MCSKSVVVIPIEVGAVVRVRVRVRVRVTITACIVGFCQDKAEYDELRVWGHGATQFWRPQKWTATDNDHSV